MGVSQPAKTENSPSGYGHKCFKYSGTDKFPDKSNDNKAYDIGNIKSGSEKSSAFDLGFQKCGKKNGKYIYDQYCSNGIDKGIFQRTDKGWIIGKKPDIIFESDKFRCFSNTVPFTEGIINTHNERNSYKQRDEENCRGYISCEFQCCFSGPSFLAVCLHKETSCPFRKNRAAEIVSRPVFVFIHAIIL